jgi:hypothetical protein
MKPALLLAGEDVTLLGELAAALNPSEYSPYVLADGRAVRHFVHGRMPEAKGAVLVLDGTENIAELRALLDAHASTRFVFLSSDYPPSPAVARVVASHAGAVLPLASDAIVVAATLVAMLAG